MTEMTTRNSKTLRPEENDELIQNHERRMSIDGTCSACTLQRINMNLNDPTVPRSH